MRNRNADVPLMARLPVELHRKVVKRAKREGISRNKVIIAALESYTDDRLDRIEADLSQLRTIFRVNARPRRLGGWGVTSA